MNRSMARGNGRRREAETEGEKGEARTSQATLLSWDQAASDVMLERICAGDQCGHFIHPFPFL